MVYEFATKSDATEFQAACKRDGETVSPVVKTTNGWLVLV